MEQLRKTVVGLRERLAQSRMASGVGAFRRMLFRAFASVGAVVAIVTLTPFTAWWAARLAAPWDATGGGILVILTGSSLEPGVAGVDSYWRCVYGARAFRLGGVSRILISGDAVAEAMKTLLMGMGVPGDAIQTETHSFSTRESAVHCRAILLSMQATPVLLTGDYHMFRAWHAFREAGIVAKGWPVPDVIKRSSGLRGRWPAFLDLLEESLKIGYYYCNGWMG